MTPDEIQAAIERAEAKARELQGLESAAIPAKVFMMLARAAEATADKLRLASNETRAQH